MQEVIKIEKGIKIGPFKKIFKTKYSLSGSTEIFDDFLEETKEMVIFEKDSLFLLYSKLTGNLLTKCFGDSEGITLFDKYRYYLASENDLESNTKTQKLYFYSSDHHIYEVGINNNNEKKDITIKKWMVNRNILFVITVDNEFIGINLNKDVNNCILFRKNLLVCIGDNECKFNELDVYEFEKHSNKFLITIRNDSYCTYGKRFFIIYNAETNTFSSEKFISYSMSYDYIKNIDGVTYFIFGNSIRTENTCSSLIDEYGNVIIKEFYSSLQFHPNLPYIYLYKGIKVGLANLEGKVLLDAIYDEVLETPEKFIANLGDNIEIVMK